EEGVTDSVGRIIEAVDQERIAIGNKLGIRVYSDPEMGMQQGYMLENNYGSGYRKAPGFLGITAQPQLDHRYINEDVGYGLVFMSRLAKQVGVETPAIDAIVQLASILMHRDYAAEALRTPDSLGIGNLTAKQLGNL
ncbi:MAG: NAD/NADP octopine/nopaline dehydrogenase family protein, partial [Lysobacterales bacterium]